MASYVEELASTASLVDDILSPMTVDKFVGQHFGKSFLHIPGTRGKFNSVLHWSELNRILEEHRLAPARLKLFQSGKSVSTEKYLYAPDAFGARLRAAELTNLLAQGATLVVDAFDELSRPVRELAVALERAFGIYTQVNLYAGWRTDLGFLLHYDEHDTVILQISGRKHWKVYRPTKLYPLEQAKDSEPAEKPIEEPIWDAILEDGDLLYMPRGWWHVAFPLDEPTLHLTAGLRNHRGLDLLHWFVNQLANCVEVRQDVPILGDRPTKIAYMEKLREHFLRRWSDDLLNRFLASADARALPRPFFQLPEAATAEGIAIRRKSQVRLIGPRRLDLSGKAENGNLTLKCFGKTLHCSTTVLPALEQLNDGQSHSVEELITIVPDQGMDIINFLQVLALQGALATVPTAM